jgi:hypothetical protein
MMGGNPSMIVILAPLLADTERTLDLTGLYKKLCEDQISKTGNDEMMGAVHISV